MTVSTTGFWSVLKVFFGTLIGNGFLVVGTLFWATVALLFGWIGSRGHFIFWVARTWSRGVLFFGGVRALPAFEVPLDQEGQYVFMANHRSLFDIPALLTTLPGQTRFLAKKSLFQIPLFGWALRMGGFVTIDRSDLSTARNSFAVAVTQLEEAGVSVLVFPEGTRSLSDELLSFQRGGFLLALKSGLAIVPVGIAGSAEIQPKKSLKIRPGVVRVNYGGPMPVQDFGVSRKQELIQEVREQVERLIALGSS
ncbi:MAG: 1-acyl-sn-glycerol-3-phosphate acyltransferase [bacterium]|nr:1-acyl-sn-glycerol-3-phosphate acyltransferase [bacterium]